MQAAEGQVTWRTENRQPREVSKLLREVNLSDIKNVAVFLLPKYIDFI